jgi:hypothetical protein
VNRLFLFFLVLGTPVLSQEPAWDTVVKGPIVLKSRALKDSAIKEYWAEGEIAAPALDVQHALETSNRLKEYMPYLKDCREISARQSDGSIYVQTLIDLPVIGKRDYVVQVWTHESIQSDGSGTFRNEWKAQADYLPRRAGIIRITHNNGGWTVTPTGDGSKSWAVYKFSTDPGGWIPAFAANMGSESGVKETYAAITKEAIKRKSERLARK